MARKSRREVLAIGAGTAAFAVFGAQPVSATPEDAAAMIATFTGGKPTAQGKISIDLPEIAENGNTVPLTVKIDSPMTADDHVTDILVLAEANPRVDLATFHLSPMSGRAEVGTRIRLAASESIRVVAKTSKGEFLMDQKPVKVTIGGCGG